MPQFTKDIFNIAPGPGRAIADPREDEARQREASARAERALQEQIQARRQSAGLQFNAQSNEMGRFMAQLGLQRDQLMAQQDEAMAQRQHEMAQFEEQQRQRGIDRSFEDAFNLRSEGRLTRGQNLEQQRHGEDLDFQRNLANAGFLDAFNTRQGEMAEAERSRDFLEEQSTTAFGRQQERDAAQRTFQSTRAEEDFARNVYLQGQDRTARETFQQRRDAARRAHEIDLLEAQIEQDRQDRVTEAQTAAGPFFQEYLAAARSGDSQKASEAMNNLHLYIRTLPPSQQRAVQDMISSIGGLDPVPTRPEDSPYSSAAKGFGAAATLGPTGAATGAAALSPLAPFLAPLLAPAAAAGAAGYGIYSNRDKISEFIENFGENAGSGFHSATHGIFR